ncbi:MAG: MtrB/PioB family outer membrane beta-barrel protein [Bacteroidales bacterium]|nr:MtrB/PioB family outer membrane beta-barrel protein [Bacteroidales bacterium]
MKVNGGMALTGVLLIAAGSALSQGASAAEPAVPAEEHGGVSISGEIEAGFRAFIERPPSYALPGILPAGRPTATGTNTNPLMGGQPSPIFNTDRDNRAKFEEYGNVRPGFYLEKIDINAQTKDGDYFADFRGDNVGNNDQRFIFDWSKAGEHYGTYSWDQIPHLYSASAQSIWSGVGTNFLTTPVWIGNVANNTLAATQTVYDRLQGNLETIDIGIKRDKFTALQRWTPNQNWDVRADYSHERREGTQIAGVIIGGMGAQQMVQLPAPVADTTQNAKLSGQYADETPWGGRFNIRTSASVSAYQNDFNSFTFENPFSATDPGASPDCGQTTAVANYPRCGRVSLAPDNQAYNFATTAGVDLPNKSRYMGTVSYT